MTTITDFQEAFSITDDFFKRTPMQPGSSRKKKFWYIYETVLQLLLTASVTSVAILRHHPRENGSGYDFTLQCENPCCILKGMLLQNSAGFVFSVNCCCWGNKNERDTLHASRTKILEWRTIQHICIRTASQAKRKADNLGGPTS